MASPWDDFWPKFLLTIVDKAILGGVFALVAYLLQKRLEIFKRNQALTSELAKARIVVYQRAISSAWSLDFAVGMLLAKHAAATTSKTPESREALRQAAEAEDKEFNIVSSLAASERHLLGDNFTDALIAFLTEAQVSTADLANLEPLDKAETMRHALERIRLLNSLVQYLPPFAKVPADDLHFGNPSGKELVALRDRGN